MDQRVVNVFWTSGLDSTFRIVELASSEGHIIQPWYIYAPERRSCNMELRRIRKMTAMIRAHRETKSELRDVKVVMLSDIVIPERISDVYSIIREKYSLGPQYLWLCSFLESVDFSVQIAAEKPHLGINRAVSGECTTEVVGEGVDACLQLVPAASSEMGTLLFSKMLFPYHIWNIYKQDEMKEMTDMGYEDVFKQTWFCHRPVFGMPCGHCHPCQDAMRDGFGWRIPVAGRRLYPVVRFFRHAFRHVFRH